MHGLFLLRGCPQNLHLALFSQSVAQGTGKKLVEFRVNLGLKSAQPTLSQDQRQDSPFKALSFPLLPLPL